jgi:hypothetical protein
MFVTTGPNWLQDFAANDTLLTPLGEIIMRMLSIGLVSVLASVNLFAQAVQPRHTHLKVGDTAPDFTLKSTANETVKLSDFRGKNVVVLAFYPAAFTGG